MKPTNILHRLTRENLLSLVSTLNKKGGPEAFEYESLNKWINSIPAMINIGELFGKGNFGTFINARIGFL